MAWNGDEYQSRFDRLTSEGVHVHGEAEFVCSIGPSRVLDAGCGTGRVSLELARRGVDVVGVDIDASMLATARSRGPGIEFAQADLATFHLGRLFDVVLMAGNVLLFTPKGTERSVVGACARHLVPGGALVAGFQLDRGYGLEDYDADCRAAGLRLDERWATWDRVPFEAAGAASAAGSAASSGSAGSAAAPTYAVSVHRRVADAEI
jgi:SAM-dependent methyltransferase